jgi:hypothetical protein
MTLISIRPVALCLCLILVFRNTLLCALTIVDFNIKLLLQFFRFRLSGVEILRMAKRAEEFSARPN